MAKFELKLPKMGESVAEATITSWLKEVGDTIELDEPVFEIATDKVDSEVPSEVEGKLIEKHNLQVTFDDLKAHAREMIKVQMAQFGQMDPSDKELDDIAARILSNQDEVKRLSEQLMSQKLLNLYKEEANLKVKEITYDDFVKEFYS